MNNIAVIGAPGVVGREILSMLAGLDVTNVVAVGSSTTSTSSVPMGEESLPVDDPETVDLGSLSLAFLAVPEDEVRGWVERLAHADVPVVVCGGASTVDPEIPLVLPALGTQALDAPRAREVVAIPEPLASATALILQPLEDAIGVVNASGLASLPASSFGRKGMDELSAQVVALMSSGTPPRAVFDRGLAFDVEPVVGATLQTGWTNREVRVALQLARLTKLRVELTLQVVPVFSGISLHLQVELDRASDSAEVTRVLEASGIVFAKPERTRPRRMEGNPAVQVGRLRVDSEGTTLWVELAFDNLRLAASTAVQLGRALSDRVG